jgi:AraC-like DNA-binding protein
LAVHEHLAAQRIAELSQRHLIHQIEQQLGGLLEQGDVQLEHVATRLGKVPRQLRSELARINLTFTEVVAGYRERLARRLLARTQEPIDQIIYLTGFSEPSAFTRAFKRWTGETPTAYRKRKQHDPI